ncbi:MAG: SGNH/GDSL hydrolase family protein [Pirellulaceae bacterium]
MKSKSAKRVRLVLLLVVAAGCLFYYQFFTSRSTGDGPAGPAVDSKPFSAVWTEKQVELVGIGDSITAGLGAKRRSHSYVNRLIGNPDDEFADMQGLCLSAVLPNLTHENLAVSGSTSEFHLEHIEFNLEMRSEDVFGIVVLTTGGNDLIHNYGRSPPVECAMYGATHEEAEPWIEAFEGRLREILDCIESRFPGGCEIYLADIYDPTDGVGDAPSIFLPDWPDGLRIHAAYNERIAKCALERSHVHMVPLYETFLGHGSHCKQFWRAHYDSSDPHYWYYSNVEDPNDRGYDAIRRVYLNSIVENTRLRGAVPVASVH